MLANLWMLKAGNGMFWYAADYLARLNRPVRVVVRPALAGLARRELASARVSVHAVGFGGFLKEVAAAVAMRRPIYAPTPHPVPFVGRQLIVFHDPFPFEGPKGERNRRLLAFGLASSRCRVAYINRSVAKPYLLGLGVPEERLLFAPNVPPAVGEALSARHPRDGQGVVRLGAFGTDSPKKRYPQLLEVLARPEYRNSVRLHLYGPLHAYADGLLRDFPVNPPVVVDQARVPLRDFILGLDAVVSAAPGEGFGRPIATALLLGVPCHLIESPVFREFFDGLATFAPDIDGLLDNAVSPPQAPLAPRCDTGFLAPAYAQAIDAAVRSIEAM